jgi:hypothetical protein
MDQEGSGLLDIAVEVRVDDEVLHVVLEAKHCESR